MSEKDQEVDGRGGDDGDGTRVSCAACLETFGSSALVYTQMNTYQRFPVCAPCLTRWEESKAELRRLPSITVSPAVIFETAYLRQHYEEILPYDDGDDAAVFDLCPQCYRVIVKDGGCHDMVCKVCWKNFFYAGSTCATPLAMLYLLAAVCNLPELFFSHEEKFPNGQRCLGSRQISSSEGEGKNEHIQTKTNVCLTHLDKKSVNQLFAAAAGHGALAAMRYIRRENALVDLMWEDGFALVMASQNNHAPVVVYLLSFSHEGVDVHTGDDLPLRVASYAGNLDVVKVLIGHAADVGAARNGALVYACTYGHLPIVSFLIGDMQSKGLDISANYSMALRMAVDNDHGAVAAAMLEAGADVHAQSEDCLCRAVEKGLLNMVRLLLRFGARREARDFYAFRKASEFDFVEIWRELATHSDGGRDREEEGEKKEKKERKRTAGCYTRELHERCRRWAVEKQSGDILAALDTFSFVLDQHQEEGSEV